MTGHPALELRSATKIHGERSREVHALVDASLVLNAGEFAAVMEPSGAGKSTLLHLAGGLDAPTQGQVLLGGQDMRLLSSDQRAALRRRSVGYVFQTSTCCPR